MSCSADFPSHVHPEPGVCDYVPDERVYVIPVAEPLDYRAFIEAMSEFSMAELTRLINEERTPLDRALDHAIEADRRRVEHDHLGAVLDVTC